MPEDTVDTAVALPRDEFYVVGIGASAGGLEALEQFFSNMPDDTDMAFVVVQHLSPDFKSLMDELLARHTSIPIFRVTDSVEVKRNAIYLIPPKKNMIMSGGKLMLTEQDPSGGLNLPIDIFFRSLAQDVGKRAIAVVLSGTGSDGSRGIQDIHQADGMVVVQTLDSAAFDGMPRSALSTGVSAVVTSPDQMPKRILEYTHNPTGFKSYDEGGDDAVLPGSELAVIFRLFRNRFGIDFTLYRANTINRRIERRMKLVKCSNLASYLAKLENDTTELDSLYRDLLVEVTHFFRDTRAFDRLRVEIIPEILRKITSPRDEIRVWVPGCATGEEAYTIAMLLDSCAQNMGVAPNVKVFATDVHRNSLETAGAGVYSADAITNVPEDLRTRYFTRHGNLYHVTRDIRQMVIFAPHDITKDPPFTKIDLLSCRNVLIYLDTLVQRRVLSLFHFGLKVDGYLLLGPSESVGELSREFQTVDQHWRIFRKLRDIRLPDAKAMPSSPPLTSIIKDTPPFTATAMLAASGAEKAVLEELLDRYVPPSFVVNEQYELLYSFGDARRMLTQPRGRPTLDVLKLVEGDLRMALSAALHRASREDQRISLKGVRMPTSSGNNLVQLVVEPYSKGTHKMYLICLEEMEEVPVVQEGTGEVFQPGDQATQRIMDLESELEFTKESLQTTVEELESSNEELQSTNEELVASNEELQSTNEELHSVNEELYTVNAEHQRKIEELTQLTADMDNLFRSTDIGTIFLDRDFCIRKFTPAIASAFNVLEQDIGRPIEQFAYHFDNPDFLDDSREVLETGESKEREVTTRDGTGTFLKRIMPYRTVEGQIDGVVIAFVDITHTKVSEALLKNERHFREVAENLDGVLWLRSCDEQTTFYVTPSFEKLWGRSREELCDNPELWSLCVHEDDRQRVVNRFRQAASDGRDYSIEYRIQLEDGSHRWVIDHANPLCDFDGKIQQIVGYTADITALKDEQHQRRQMQDLYDNLPVMTASSELPEGTLCQCSNYLLEKLGYEREDLIGRHVSEMYHPNCHAILQEAIDEFLSTGVLRATGLEMKRKDGTAIPVRVLATAIRNEQNEIIASRAVMHEITEPPTS